MRDTGKSIYTLEAEQDYYRQTAEYFNGPLSQFPCEVSEVIESSPDFLMFVTYQGMESWKYHPGEYRVFPYPPHYGMLSPELHEYFERTTSNLLRLLSEDDQIPEKYPSDILRFCHYFLSTDIGSSLAGCVMSAVEDKEIWARMRDAVRQRGFLVCLNQWADFVRRPTKDRLIGDENPFYPLLALHEIKHYRRDRDSDQVFDESLWKFNAVLVQQMMHEITYQEIDEFCDKWVKRTKAADQLKKDREKNRGKPTKVSKKGSRKRRNPMVLDSISELIRRDWITRSLWSMPTKQIMDEYPEFADEAKGACENMDDSISNIDREISKCGFTRFEGSKFKI